MSKTFEELTIKDNFMFGAVMRNPYKCKLVLECILDIKIRKIEYPELEKTIDKTYESKSIRLDVYVEDDKNTIYNVEMQATDKKNLPKRTRYYQGMIDLNIIDKGDNYNKLKKSYVIFICDYDEFGLGRHIYTFEKQCKEVQKVKANEDWRRDYMTMKMLMSETKELEHHRTLVSIIKEAEADVDTIMLSKVLKVSEEYINKTLSLINENPNMDDEELAEILVNLEE